MGTTKIQWTDHTINPGIYGCSPEHTGCRNCYAAKMAHRLAGMGQLQYDGVSDGSRWIPWKSRRDYDQTTTWGGVSVDFDAIPRAFAKLPKRKPARVFVTSMGDLFHPDVPFQFISNVFGAMALRPHLTFQVLTKRPARIIDWMDWGQHGRWPPNIWNGASISDQETADSMIHYLLRVPAAVRFLSVEPMIGPVDLDDMLGRCDGRCMAVEDFDSSKDECSSDHGIGWVIVGCESGPNRRPMQLQWARDVVEQCGDANVACFVKQLDIDGQVVSDPDDPRWPSWAVREFPEVAS